MKKSDGFTLVELLVGILCAAIVTGAAMTLMLMGARTNRALLDANSEQQTARIITTMVESLASEGDIQKIYVSYEKMNDYGEQDWAIWGSDPDSPILAYSFDTQEIASTGSTILMSGVTSSTLTLSRNTLDGCLLGFTIQTEDGYYETSTYCRSVDIETDGMVLDKDNVSIEVPDGDDIPDTLAPTPESTSAGRYALLEVLCTQYGSTGQIKSPYFGTYFSEWYLQAKNNNPALTYASYNRNLGPGETKWSPLTPWCACFISWGVAQISEYLLTFPCEADVTQLESRFELKTDSLGYNPVAGDVIFFDWSNNGLNGTEHVGIVFGIDSTYVYTIEGNNSGRVELNRYLRTSDDIVGYGVLDWKPNPTT